MGRGTFGWPIATDRGVGRRRSHGPHFQRRRTVSGNQDRPRKHVGLRRAWRGGRPRRGGRAPGRSTLSRNRRGCGRIQRTRIGIRPRKPVTRRRETRGGPWRRIGSEEYCACGQIQIQGSRRWDGWCRCGWLGGWRQSPCFGHIARAKKTEGSPARSGRRRRRRRLRARRAWYP